MKNKTLNYISFILALISVGLLLALLQITIKNQSKEPEYIIVDPFEYKPYTL